MAVLTAHSITEQQAVDTEMRLSAEQTVRFLLHMAQEETAVGREGAWEILMEPAEITHQVQDDPQVEEEAAVVVGAVVRPLPELLEVQGVLK